MSDAPVPVIGVYDGAVIIEFRGIQAASAQQAAQMMMNGISVSASASSRIVQPIKVQVAPALAAPQQSQPLKLVTN